MLTSYGYPRDHCIDNQERERGCHLATNYGPVGLWETTLTHHQRCSKVDVDALCARIPLWQSAEKGPKMGSHGT